MSSNIEVFSLTEVKYSDPTMKNGWVLRNNQNYHTIYNVIPEIELIIVILDFFRSI